MSKPLSDLIARERWFHGIDFGGGLVSEDRFGPAVPPNYTLYGVFELLRWLDPAGGRAVDVGTMDGLVAFVLGARGAGEVIATDLARRETFEAGRAHLGLDIDYRVPLAALELPRALGDARADVVVMAGVLYHVFDPLAVLVAARRSLLREGFLIVETSYLFDEGRARMSFNPADVTGRALAHPNVFWRPSQRALEGMLELVGFEVVASVRVDGRIAVLAQAKRPSQIEPSTELLATVHRRYMRYANYREQVDFDALERDEGPTARARYEGPRGPRRLYPSLYRPDVPFQPPWEPRRRSDRLRQAARSAWFHGVSSMAELRHAVAARGAR